MNILLIALHYHDYTLNIASELRSLGHQVKVHDIMPRTFFMKSLRIVSTASWQKALDKHHEHIVELERENSYDLVLFIQVHQISHANMARFIEAFPASRFALYNWDSISNHDYRPYLSYFDDVSTFDPEDAKTHGLHYLPLFASREFQGLERRDQAKRAVYFVGNIVNPARYGAFDAFRDYCKREAISLQAFMVCTPPVWVKMFRAGYKPHGLAARPIEKAHFVEMVETSVAVFDFSNHAQTGYTMRIFENLCSGKKIITNNGRILAETFYSPDRIHVFNETDYSGVKAFLELPLADEEETFPAYHIQSFVRHLVDGTSHALPLAAG